MKGLLGHVPGGRSPSAFRTGCLILLAACLVISPVWAEDAAEPGFATPEDAIRHFAGALATGDFDGAIEACAVREQAEGFDFPGYVERFKSHMAVTMPAPATSDFFRDLNAASTLGSLATQAKVLVYSFFVTEGLGGQSVSADRAYAEGFQQAVDASKLASLKLLRIDPPKKSHLWNAHNIQNFDRTARLFGADAMTERIALYDLDGKTFAGGFGLYRFPSGWKICRLASNLAGLPVTGAAQPATLQDYADML